MISPLNNILYLLNDLTCYKYHDKKFKLAIQSYVSPNQSFKNQGSVI